MRHCNVQFEDFPFHSQNTIMKLFESDSFADVTIVCNDGDFIPAHKFILSSSSAVLHQMLLGYANRYQPRTDFIYLPTVKKSELIPLLQFLYLGQAKIKQENVESFFRLAADLKINIGKSEGASNSAHKEEKKQPQKDHPAVKDQNTNSETTSESNKKEDFKGFVKFGIFKNSQSENNDVSKDAKAFSEAFITYEETENIPEERNAEPIKSDQVIDKSEETVEVNLKGLQNLCDNNDNESLGLEEEAFQICEISRGKNEADNKKSGKKSKRKVKAKKLDNPADLDSNSKICQICHKALTSIPRMQRHYQTIHKQMKYPCDFCDHKATLPNSLKKHIRNEHSHEILSCKDCSFEANTETKLKDHIQKNHQI